jgi:hypothetical protein
MNKSRLLALSVVLLVLIGGGLWLQRSSRHVVTPPVPAAKTTVDAPAKAKPPAPPPATAEVPAISLPAVTATRPAASQNLSIENLLSATSLDNKTVMAGLTEITLDARRSQSERSEALSHLRNLSVTDPAPVLLPLVIDARLPDALCIEILDDALNAPESWQADAYLAALTHRKDKEIQTKARKHLTFLVGADHGDNLAEWSTAIALSKKTWAQAQ